MTSASRCGGLERLEARGGRRGCRRRPRPWWPRRPARRGSGVDSSSSQSPTSMRCEFQLSRMPPADRHAAADVGVAVRRRPGDRCVAGARASRCRATACSCGRRPRSHAPSARALAVTFSSGRRVFCPRPPRTRPTGTARRGRARSRCRPRRRRWSAGRPASGAGCRTRSARRAWPGDRRARWPGGPPGGAGRRRRRRGRRRASALGGEVEHRRPGRPSAGRGRSGTCPLPGLPSLGGHGAPGEDVGAVADVVLGVAGRHPDGVQLEQLAPVVLVDRVLGRLLGGEVAQHRWVATGRDEHVGEVAERVGPDHVTVVRRRRRPRSRGRGSAR